MSGTITINSTDLINAVKPQLLQMPEITLQPCSYIIYTDGRNYCAKNGSTGEIEYYDTDASNVIQYAINNVDVSGGGKVFIKSGTYPITKTIDPKSNIIIEGEGWNTVLQYALSNPNPVIEGYNVSKVVLKNFVVDGMDINSGEKDLIHFAHSSYIRIEGLEIRNKKGTHNGDAIDMDDVTYFWVLNNYIHDIDGGGIHPSNADSPPYYGSCKGVIAYNILINTNRVANKAPIHVSGDSTLTGATPPQDIIIIGNYIDTSPDYGIFIQSLKISIIGNIIKNVGTGIMVSPFGSTASEAIDIIGNIIESTTASHGIVLYASTSGLVKKVSIVGNSIRNAYKSGIQLTSATETTIVANNVYNPGWGSFQDAPGTSKYIVAFNIFEKYIVTQQSPRIVRGNIGYLTENSGVAKISAGSTSVTVSHGLATTPSKVLITPLGQPQGKLWVENITSTSFNIATDTAPTVDLNVAWYAEV